jgi:hypothetical protein
MLFTLSERELLVTGRHLLRLHLTSKLKTCLIGQSPVLICGGILPSGWTLDFLEIVECPPIDSRSAVTYLRGPSKLL